MNDKVSTIVMGVFVSILGLVGLILAAGAVDTPVYGFGLGTFVFAVLYDFLLIKFWFDAHRHAGF